MISDQQILNSKILIIDDQKLDSIVLEKILKSANYKNIRCITDSRQAKVVYSEYQPDLLLLDLRMPNIDGFEIMNQLKEVDADGYLPILVISSETSHEVRLRALQSGAKDFLNKPYESVEVLARSRNLIEVRMLHNQARDYTKILEAQVKERTEELHDTRLDIIHRLAQAAEYRDNETGLHIVRMGQYSACLGAAMGMSAAQCELLLHASPLHDIGKIGIPDYILLKPGKLDPDEWEIMKTHTTLGAQLLSGSRFALMKMGEQIALAHHEKWDGTGYPKGLKREDISLVGRICGLCDVFDALTSKRPYKEAWPVEKAVTEIKNGSGRHFDPKIVECLMDTLSKFVEIKDKFDEPESP